MKSKKLIRIDKVLALTGLSRSNLYLKISYHTFPSQINLGGRSVAWIEQEILDWIEQQISNSRPSQNNFQKEAA